jgi:PAS domain S-box-containing protein
MLAMASFILSIAQFSIWPLIWGAAVGGLLGLEPHQMLRTSRAIGTDDERKQERLLMGLGLLVTGTFLLLPMSLAVTLEYQNIFAAVALMTAAATRSASMFAVSKRVGLAYALPYFTLPTSGLIILHVTTDAIDMSGLIVSCASITCALAYIWRSWVTRHSAERALDEAYAVAEEKRDDATRDATVSRLLFEHTAMRAALFDKSGCFIAVNPSWLAAIEKTEAEVIGKHLCEAMPHFEDKWSVALNAALNGKATSAAADPRTRVDGQRVFLDWEVQPWYDESGKLGGAVAYAQDVTEKVEARAAARLKQERLELALKANKACIWEVDYLTKSVTFDEDATALYGKAVTFEMATTLKGMDVHPDDVEATRRQIAKAMQNGGVGRMEARHIQPDGSIRWIRSDLSPKTFTNGRPSSFILMTSDVTEEMARHERLVVMMERAQGTLNEKRKLLEELCLETSAQNLVIGDGAGDAAAVLCATESDDSTFGQIFARFDQILSEIDSRDTALAAAVQQLRDARANAEAANVAKSQFLANMSHELRTPLNAIIGYTEILIEDAEYEQRLDAANDANKVRSSATHLLGLINEILDLSKIEAGKMDISREPTPLTDVLTDIMTSATPLAAPNNNRIHLDIDCDRTLALTDGFRLRQCLLNLMSNACKFTKNGDITLQLKMTQAGEDQRWFDISVIDTGIGISEAQLLRLFKPFSQADGSTTRKYGGTGLGLALTREMVTLLGGEVFVESVVGEGSTFTIRLPALGLDAEDVLTTFSATSSAPMVLVIDDDPLARALTARSATALGMSIASAETGRAALAYCDQNHVDLIVLDLNLPDMDGNDVLAALRGSEKSRHTPVMVVSIEDDRRRSISAGAQEHLAKPCPSAVLTAAIARLVRREDAKDLLINPDTQKPFDLAAPDVETSGKNKKRSA